VTAQFDSALLLNNTPIGRGIHLTKWYKYQGYMVIHQWVQDIFETLFFSFNINTAGRTRRFEQKVMDNLTNAIQFLQGLHIIIQHHVQNGSETHLYFYHTSIRGSFQRLFLL
jgi:hypothetical protein